MSSLSSTTSTDAGQDKVAMRTAVYLQKIEERMAHQVASSWEHDGSFYLQTSAHAGGLRQERRVRNDGRQVRRTQSSPTIRMSSSRSNGFLIRRNPCGSLLSTAETTTTGSVARRSSWDSALMRSQPLMTGIIRSARMSDGCGISFRS